MTPPAAAGGDTTGYCNFDCTFPGWLTYGDSLQADNGSFGIPSTVCAYFGCNGALFNYSGTNPNPAPHNAITVDGQASGGSDCVSMYGRYSSNTDSSNFGLGIPGWANQGPLSFYNGHRYVNLVTVQCGANDYVHGNTAAQAYTGITNLVAAAKATGYTVIVATMVDSCHVAQQPGAEDSFRSPLNASIRNGAVANGYAVVDYAANANIGADGAALGPTYFQTPEPGCATGGVHPNAAGIAIEATLMEAAMAAISFP